MEIKLSKPEVKLLYVDSVLNNSKINSVDILTLLMEYPTATSFKFRQSYSIQDTVNVVPLDYLDRPLEGFPETSIGELTLSDIWCMVN